MNYAIILAGGIGSRMGTDGPPKQYCMVEGKPVLVFTLEKFEQCPAVDRIVVVASESWHGRISDWAGEYSIVKLRSLAPAGSSRQSSVLSGLDACLAEGGGKDDVVVIHDAARPLVSISLIEECISAAARYGGCMPVLPVHDTVYRSSDGARISGLLDREQLFVGQTPEAYRLDAYARLNREADGDELRSCHGSSEIAYRHGMEVRLIPGAEMNFKLTTPEDMSRFRTICARRE